MGSSIKNENQLHRDLLILIWAISWAASHGRSISKAPHAVHDSTRMRPLLPIHCQNRRMAQ